MHWWQGGNMYQDRLELYKDLERKRDSKLLVYVTGDRPGLETQIHPEVLDLLVDHLDTIGVVSKISLSTTTQQCCLGGKTKWPTSSGEPLLRV